MFGARVAAAAACLMALLTSPLAAQETEPTAHALASPDGRVQVSVRLDRTGAPAFTVSLGGAPVAAGTLGLEFAGSGPLAEHLRIIGTRRNSVDETYTIPVGKAASARDRHHELVISLQEHAPPRRRLELAFCAFDDGIAFRYQLPQQASLGEFVLTDELTQFTFPGDAIAHALPLRNYTTPYEWYYDSKPVAELGHTQLYGLPMLLEGSGGVWMALTEAGLTDYAGLYLSRAAEAPATLVAKLSPLPGRQDAAKVLGRTPFASPWRVLMMADDPGRLIESNLVFHLNPPSQIADTSWIVPGQTTFPWWNHYVLEGVDFEPGVNTATMKHYIDFCAEQGIAYHSLDGLDIAWYGGPIHPNGPTDITTAAPSIDLPELLRYAKQKGVRLRLWLHWKALKPQIDEAFALYEQWGIEGVMVDFMDRDDQDMVRFYHEMAEKAAQHHLTLSLHGAYKPTGLERTWPNVLTYEAVLNQEYNKWQPPGVKGTPPRHNLNVAFIRMLAGPLDYHQGGMRNVLPENYKFRDIAPPVQGTRGHQLAMYIVYQNHLPMLADYPAAYRGQPELEFLADIPTTWDETRVLHAEFGACLVIARRSGDAWYIGGMTAEQSQELTLPLDMLGTGPFAVELYTDDPTAGPQTVRQHTQTLTPGTPLRVTLPASGGFAARLTPHDPPGERGQ